MFKKIHYYLIVRQNSNSNQSEQSVLTTYCKLLRKILGVDLGACKTKQSMVWVSFVRWVALVEAICVLYYLLVGRLDCVCLTCRRRLVDDDDNNKSTKRKDLCPQMISEKQNPNVCKCCITS